jgi:hypothetical protein
VKPKPRWNCRFGGEEGRQGSSDGKRLWGQSGRLGIDRYAEGWLPGSLVGFGGKVMSGGSVKAFPRCSEKSPRELKLRRGSGRWSG